ncbi:putative ABC transporter permease [uncultured Vagococcus sp.]|uniref:putative ABC transporter permease n=1 Tax=uncultured Vagococcus sp. TaxID=189676 RepID=UPI0028D6CB4D|nr:hypothetical protein [uncultured Vagococcus sp.]
MSIVNRVVLLFFIYSVIGWLWETVYCSLKAKKFVYRGFLVGPYCPIYGFGVVSVLYFVEPYQNNLVVLYFFSAVLVTVLEYLTSYVLEKLFHATWWDYHDVPLNINGRVAVPVSLFWGVACVLIVKVINPQVLMLAQLLERTFGNALPIILLVVMAVDLVYTVTSMLAFRKAMAAWSSAVESSKAELKARVATEFEEKKEKLEVSRSELWAKLHEKNSELVKLPKIKLNHRRVLGGFSQLKMTDVANMEELRAALKELRPKK